MKHSVIIFLLLVFFTTLSVSAQKNVLNCAENLRKADLKNASVSSVIKRNPRNNKVVMRLLTVNGVPPKQMKQMIKAMDSDLKEANYVDRQSSNSLTHFVMHFNDRRTGRVVRVACQYRGDYLAGEIYVREDYPGNTTFNELPDTFIEDLLPSFGETLQYELLTLGDIEDYTDSDGRQIRILYNF